MPIVRTVDGTVIECSTEELPSVLAVLRQPQHAKTGGNGTSDGSSTTPPSTVSPLTTSNNAVVWTEARARALWNWFYGDQKKLIDLLMVQPLSGKQIQKALNIDGHVLSGLLSCITRNAKRETKYDDARVIDWKPEGGTDRGSTTFSPK